jgi:hypothetical protein
VLKMALNTINQPSKMYLYKYNFAPYIFFIVHVYL